MGSYYEPLLPPEVVTLSNVLGITDYTVDSINEAMTRYPDCVRDLADRGAQRVCLNGIPISVQLGRQRVLELMETTQRDFGVVGDTAGEQHERRETPVAGGRGAEFFLKRFVSGLQQRFGD